MRTLLRLTVANLQSLIRDRAALFWTFFFPVMFVLLFGAIFSSSGSTSKFPLGVVDQDGTPAGLALRQALEQSGVFDVKTGSLDQEKQAMQNGDVAGIVVIPSGLGAALAGHPTGGQLEVGVYTDPGRQTTGQIINQVVRQIVNGFNMQAANAKPILSIGNQSLASTDISFVSYLVPSILAMALMQLGVFACVPLVEQREKGILKRLGATPLPRWSLVGSNILVRLIVAAIQTLLILGIGVVAFNVSITGNLLAIGGIVFLGAAMFLSLGYLMAAFLKTEEQANGVTQVVQMPMMFLSGIFFPFAMLPDFLGQIGRVMPLTYLADAMRQTMVNAPALAPLSVDVAIIGGWLVICLGISVRFFRWE